LESLSIHELRPLESGGVIARNGLNYQDHRAAGFCLEMLGDKTLSQVWCEDQDDITLIWQVNGQEEVEFVQVKSNEFDQLWSAAKLYERKKAQKDTSILERSLAYDRCKEPCRFRIVTAHPVMPELSALKLAPDHPNRAGKKAEIDALRDKLDEHLDRCMSPNGHDISFWLAHTRWEVAGLEDAIRAKNLVELQRLVDSYGGPVCQDSKTGAKS